MDGASVTEGEVPRWFHFTPGESTDETLDLVVLCQPHDQDTGEQLEEELEELLDLRTASL